MGHDDGHRVGSLALLMNEVNALPLDGGVEVGEGIQAGLGLAPVKAVLPVGHQLLDVVQIGAVVPLGAGDLVRPAHVIQPVPEVFQHVVGYVDGVGLYRHG